MKLTRSLPLLISFDRPDWAGREWIVPPLTRRQARAIFALDPDDTTAPESPAAIEERVAAQVKIAAEEARELDPDTARPIADSALPIGELTAEEERQFLIAVVNHHRGQDPASALALHSLLKKNALAALAAVARGGSIPSTATA